MRCKGEEGGKDDPKVLGTNDLSHLCEYILPALSKHCSEHCFGELHKDSMLVCGACRFLTPDPRSFALLYMEPCSHTDLTLAHSYLMLRTKLEYYLFSEAFLK